MTQTNNVNTPVLKEYFDISTYRIVKMDPNDEKVKGLVNNEISNLYTVDYLKKNNFKQYLKNTNLFISAIQEENLEKIKLFEELFGDDYNKYSSGLMNGYRAPCHAIACGTGNMEIIEHFEQVFEERFKCDQKNSAGYNIFYETRGMDAFANAAQNGHIHVMEHLIKKYNWNINVKDHSDRNIFLIACQYGHFDVVKWIFDKYPDYDYLSKDINRYNGLYLAALSDNLELVKYLNCKMNFVNDKWNILPSNCKCFLLGKLIMTKKNNSVAIFNHLVNTYKWDIDAAKVENLNLLFYSIVKRNANMTKNLIENYNFDVREVCNYTKQSAIDFAKKNSIECYRCIMQEIVLIDYKEYKEFYSSNDCLICKNDIVENDKYVTCVNGHTCHKNCYKEYLLSGIGKEKCTYCKKDMIKVILTK